MIQTKIKPKDLIIQKFSNFLVINFLPLAHLRISLLAVEGGQSWPKIGMQLLIQGLKLGVENVQLLAYVQLAFRRVKAKLLGWQFVDGTPHGSGIRETIQTGA
jgi:hypothetical protein